MDSKLFGKYERVRDRKTERGELLKYFADELNESRGKRPKLTIGRMGKVLEGLEVKDLYYMQSAFKDRLNRNGRESASKWFWWSLKEEKKEHATHN